MPGLGPVPEARQVYIMGSCAIMPTLQGKGEGRGNARRGMLRNCHYVKGALALRSGGIDRIRQSHNKPQEAATARDGPVRLPEQGSALEAEA